MSAKASATERQNAAWAMIVPTIADGGEWYHALQRSPRALRVNPYIDTTHYHDRENFAP